MACICYKAGIGKKFVFLRIKLFLLVTIKLLTTFHEIKGKKD